MDDLELIRRYVDRGEQSAFGELVRRHVDLVYSAAARQVGAAHAEDVCQGVFLELARKAGTLRQDSTVGTWLYVVTRRTAVDWIRKESRRMKRERAALEDATMDPDAGGRPPETDWTRLGPRLDAAMEALSQEDRRALVMRFFEKRRLNEIAAALRLSEDAAQKRVSRALDKLRDGLAARGVTTLSALLAMELSTHAVQPAPSGIASGLARLAKVPVVAVGGWLLPTAGLVALAAAAAFALKETRSAQAEQIRVQALEQNWTVVSAPVRAAVAPAAVPQVDADQGLRLKIAAMLNGVTALREKLKDTPGRSIPEMAFLTDQDWLEVARKHGRLVTDADYRQAFSELRETAKSHVAQLMEAALTKFAGDHSGQNPTDVLQLAPYFSPPLDYAILQRYEVIPHATSNSGVIGEKPSALVDDTYETAFTIGPVGYGSSGSAGPSESMPFSLVTAIQRANEAYRGDHPGRGSVSPQALVPYFENPADAARYLASRNGNP